MGQGGRGQYFGRLISLTYSHIPQNIGLFHGGHEKTSDPREGNRKITDLTPVPLIFFR